jgi:hypothetical protein
MKKSVLTRGGLCNPHNPVNSDSKPSVSVNFTNDFQLVRFQLRTKLRTGQITDNQRKSMFILDKASICSWNLDLLFILTPSVYFLRYCYPILFIICTIFYNRPFPRTQVYFNNVQILKPRMVGSF